MTQLIEINLLPIEERKIERDFTWLLDVKVVAPTFLVILSLLAYLLAQKITKRNLEDKKETLVLLQRDINKKRNILKQIKKLEGLLREKNAKNQSLKSIRHNRQLWVRILEGLSKTLPSNSWISQIKQQSETTLVINGATFLFSEVAFYMIDLDRDPYFQNITLNKIEVDPSKKTDAFRFILNLNLNLDVKEPPKQGKNPAPSQALAKL